MSAKENKAIVRRLFDESPNPDLVDEFWAAEYVGPGGTSSREDLKKALAANLAGLPDLRYEIEDMIAVKDQVVVRYTASCTQTGEWFGLAPTNNQATWGGVSIYRIADGKIVEWWQYSDQVGLWRQIGLLPSFRELAEQANSKQ
jgi:predicted ester cyclase